MKKQYLEAGRVTNTHGLRGEVKFEHWCDNINSLKKAKFLYTDDMGQNALKILSQRKQGELLLLTFEAFDDIDKARALKGKVLYVDRDDIFLPDGAVFISDLIGLEVFDTRSGKKHGVIRDVINRGASDIYVIDTPEKKEVLFPAIPVFIDRVEIEKGVYINPPEGLFE